MSIGNRRSFMQGVSAATLAWGAVPILGQKTDRKYRVALIGSGWWGMNLLREALASGRAQCVALCDVDQDKLDFGKDDVEAESGDKPKVFKDYRELLAEVKPEICIIATPDHWHALQTIACVEAGAHVLVEKPTGHTINESIAMVRAAKRMDKVVQVGLHRRIGPHHVEAMTFLKSGQVGRWGRCGCLRIARVGPRCRNRMLNRRREWTGICGVGRRRCVRLILSCIRGDGVAFWSMRMARWETGGCIGWTRCCGGVGRRRRSRCIARVGG
jgi:hypothetical protein